MSENFRVALLGNPNCGKSALFNKLTGARQKIANYPGVTVERVAGILALPDGTQAEVIDLPGAYAFDASSPDEEVTRQVVQGEFPGEAEPDVLVLVLDAGNLEQHLVFAQEVLALGKPTIVALNMIDMAERDGLKLDATILSQALGVPVIETVAVRRRGLDDLKSAIADARAQIGTHADRPVMDATERRLEARTIAKATVYETSKARHLGDRLDSVLLNPWAGPLILLVLLFVIFQAVFAWAAPLTDALDGGAGALGAWVEGGFGNPIRKPG